MRASSDLQTAEPALSRWEVWGTSVTLGVVTPGALEGAHAVVAEEIARIDATCNRFRGDSDVSRCNADAGDWVEVGPLFLCALQVALDAAEATDGAVDPTVGGALVDLGYDRDYDDVALCDAGPLHASSRGVPGWQTVDVDRASRRVRLAPGSQLDLGATAKALCVDRAAARAAEAVRCGVMVDIGGDLATAGRAPSDGWRIAVIESARQPVLSDDCVVAVHDGALASSGTTVRTWRRGRRVLHHIIDPRTGWPAETVWRLVTVAAGSCVAANVASTSAVIGGEDSLFDLAQRGLAARFVRTDGQVVAVGGWPEDPAPAAHAMKRSA